MIEERPSLYVVHATPVSDSSEPAGVQLAGTRRTAQIESVDEEFAPTMLAADVYR
ncbi:hypothetical protein [Pedococcus sp. P5_B7]